MIQIKDVTKLYPAKEVGNGTGKDASSIKALDNISLHVTAGEWLSIMGPSGSGKSTLVNLIGCLDRPSVGEIWLDGQNVAGISASDLNRVRSEKIGFIFQQFHLIPFLTAVENVMLAQYFHSMTDEKEAQEALARVGLGERAHHLPSQLSGGEQQRVCIARALINDPKIILADEPTGNLDAVNEEIVLRLLREFHHQGRTIVMVTHDPVVARLADRRIELHHGKIASQEVFSMADEEQLDEVLEELWVLAEHGEIAEVERMEVHGALPVSLAIEKMIDMGLVASMPHPPQAHDHKPFINPCHEALKPVAASLGDGTLDCGTHAGAAAIGRAALSDGIGWPRDFSPTAWPWTANRRSSSKPASSSTFFLRKRPIKSVPSSGTHAPARTELRFRRGHAAGHAPCPKPLSVPRELETK